MEKLESLKEKLEKLETLKTRLVEEEESLTKTHNRDKARKRKWRKEKKADEANNLIREVGKAERKEKQRMLEDRWRMVRWLAEFIDLNKDKLGQRETPEMDLKRWEGLDQAEKIKAIKEREK